ncbi:MAG: response regulator [Deltaproteobacteria bacterium]|nr:response regulator [Deltaproteobacteria bacterium]MBW2075620.1 response regulator [Deltaproteobacteria bacterium]
MANILIIDDQPCVRELISEELFLEGYQVHGVGDIESVREHLQFSQPDLVVLDLYLDGPEGFGLFEHIKRQHPDLPVIVYTAYDSYVDDRRLSRADGYVIKSICLDELKGEIADVLDRQRDYRGTVEAELRYPEVSLSHAF